MIELTLYHDGHITIIYITSMDKPLHELARDGEIFIENQEECHLQSGQ